MWSPGCLSRKISKVFLNSRFSLKNYNPVFKVHHHHLHVVYPRVSWGSCKVSIVSLYLTPFCKLLYHPACEHAGYPKKSQEDENQDVAKGIESSFTDDRLIDLTAEIMKGQESARKEQWEGRWPEKNKKVRVGQREVHWHTGKMSRAHVTRNCLQPAADTTGVSQLLQSVACYLYSP